MQSMDPLECRAIDDSSCHNLDAPPPWTQELNADVFMVHSHGSRPSILTNIRYRTANACRDIYHLLGLSIHVDSCSAPNDGSSSPASSSLTLSAFFSSRELGRTASNSLQTAWGVEGFGNYLWDFRYDLFWSCACFAKSCSASFVIGTSSP